MKSNITQKDAVKNPTFGLKLMESPYMNPANRKESSESCGAVSERSESFFRDPKKLMTENPHVESHQ